MRCCSVLGLGVAFLIGSSSAASAQGFYGVDATCIQRLTACESDCERMFDANTQELIRVGMDPEAAGYRALELFAECYQRNCAPLADRIAAECRPRSCLEMFLGIF
jgi:hypothetical protein